ncbi:hypothetical protein KQX54_018725 [Cotesia glomerata]|uniref:Peptidase S1 domain-containing protein n=1 Tax=Cotesia glomerata TaxID=32391 RepID=A0AAV7J5C0_COTGL|nr:hypothetical protein KQX54_018725 [Cotesia glomerata]
MILKFVVALVFYFIASALSSQLDLTEGSPRLYENSSSINQPAPWHVSIRINGVHFCSGAIIGRDWVVTSAQCIASCTGTNRLITIQTASANFTISGSIHSIMTSIIHESYSTINCNLPTNDIGLLRISDYFNLDGPHAPKIINLNSSFTAPPDRKLNISNWNQDLVDGKISTNVEVSNWAILSSQQCIQYYYSMSGIDRSRFCAIDIEGPTGNPCSIGDTGNPVVLNGQLVGIKSWKMNCNLLPQAASLFTNIPVEKRFPHPSPIIELRAVKNEIEILGMRKAHLRDAVAMCDFMAYMEEQLKYKTTKWDEMQVARVVNEFRLEMDYNQGISFPTIVGYGPHAALPHYEPIDSTSLMIELNSTLVIDSGGQYLDGTTDVTRTIHFGEPTQEQKEAYTRVLIGSIELASLIFPSSLRTDQLDILARRPLWGMGNDYMHGTGHGIGHFLSVHEPPISVSYNMNATPTAGCTCYLSPGNFLSNEPGYYKAGDFGIRLENILEVVEADTPQQDKQRFLKFRDVTLIPYEPKLIDTSMLSSAHRRWLNNYNSRIRNEVGPELKKHLRMVGFKWMMKKTRSIPESGDVDERLFVGAASPSYFKYSGALITIVILIQIWADELLIL